MQWYVSKPRFSRAAAMAVAALAAGVLCMAGPAHAQPPGYTLQFNDESEFIELDNIYTSQGEIAISSWVYIPDGAGDRQTIFWNGGGWNRNGIYHEVLGGGATREVIFQLGDGDGEIRAGGGEVQVDEWTHIHCQWVGGQIVYYVNGAQVFTADWDAGYNHNDDFAAQIGAARDGDGELGRFFGGRLASLAIWDRALSPAEIQNAMHGHLQGDEDGLVGYWPLNEGSGDTIGDITGNDNTGDVQGSVDWSFEFPFVTDLSGQITSLGQTVTLGPVEIAAPSGDVTYEWFHDGDVIDGATESSLTITDVTTDDAGTYYVVVDDDRDDTPVESSHVQLDVWENLPVGGATGLLILGGALAAAALGAGRMKRRA